MEKKGKKIYPRLATMGIQTDWVTYEWKGTGEGISLLGNDGCANLRTDWVTYEWKRKGELRRFIPAWQ